MMMITTRSSIRVKPPWSELREILLRRLVSTEYFLLGRETVRAYRRERPAA
jgi:hypothetical protein